ncbi:hypothetical protein BS78_K226500 [Paspalum vaginatum]|uniref:Uncharacterized protein n=1 Tax=Paspalum vaginatum TaxID=158149 RepID=A0A9W8CGA0_9POAL|nr:hypothetical protein BS78_K226500 [Paspalum vaginatum]
MERQTRLLLFGLIVGVLIVSSAAAAAMHLSAAGGQAMPSLQVLLHVEHDARSFVKGVEEAAYLQRRALYDGRSISYGALAASKASCYGRCPARGQAYSHGCLAINQCRG